MTLVHRPRKRFGQHFLIDNEVIDRMVSAIAPQPGETLVEIGPGHGAITTPLAACGVTLHAIEFDRDLAAALRTRFAADRHVTVHLGDALRFDFASLGSALRIVGNLPYNISTPLLFRFADFRHVIHDIHVMLQREVVARIVATPGSKDYGRLTIMLGSVMASESLFEVPPEAFRPRPKVTSAVVRLEPHPPGTFYVRDRARLSALVARAFGKRRKTLRNALRGQADEAVLRACGIDPGARPEDVAIDRWLELANRT